MRRFNLLEEPWIVVMTDNKGSTRKVSLIEVFTKAHEFKRLAGDTPAQDFAILRFLLAIMHTVFSRLDSEGREYEWLELDHKFRQISDVDEEDEEEYSQALYETWKNLWGLSKLPPLIVEYLEKWSDRFNLYDEEYPFYQVTEKDLQSKKVVKTGSINPKLMNRLISESNNKIELFSPASESFKNNLDNSELARWLIAFQGYTGTGDKAKFPGMKVSASKGWLLGIGGVYLSGKSLKETLLLNMKALDSPKAQKPVWEKDIDHTISDLLHKQPDNLSELYTNWSRLIKIENRANESEIAKIEVVQLPGINPQEFYLEQMTLWRYPKSGKDKNHWVPKAHDVNRFIWRSFDQISTSINKKSENKMPGIIEWHNQLIGDKQLKGGVITVASVGLSYNRDASTMPNDDIYDELNIYDEILADVGKEGWVPRISEEIQKIETAIGYVLKGFLEDISKIRNISSEGIVGVHVQEAYFQVDIPFREWLLDLRPNDSKEETVRRWRLELKDLVINQAEQLLSTAGNRDFIGVEVNSRYINIEIAYNIFKARLNKTLLVEEGGN